MSDCVKPTSISVPVTYPDVAPSANHRLTRGSVHPQVELPVSRQREGTGLKLVRGHLIQNARMDVRHWLFLGTKLSIARVRRILGSKVCLANIVKGIYLVELIVSESHGVNDVCRCLHTIGNKEHICNLNYRLVIFGKRQCTGLQIL